MINLDKINKGFGSVLELKDDLALSSYSDRIEPNNIKLAENNPYSLNDTDENIRELATSISAVGLLHPLVVRQLDENNYQLISGERRYKAITKHLNWRTIPCTVYFDISDEQAQLMLHDANLSTREYTPQEKLVFYPQIEECINRMIDSGTLKGAKQKAMADLLHISDRQIRKYKTIRENLSEEEIHEVETGNVSVNAAYEKAKEVKSEESGTGSAFDLEATEKYWEPIFESFIKWYYGKEAVFKYYILSVPTTAEAIKETLRPRGGFHGGNSFKQAYFTLRTPRIELQLQNESLKNAPSNIQTTHIYTYTEVDAAIRRLINSHELIDLTKAIKCYREVSTELYELRRKERNQ